MKKKSQIELDRDREVYTKYTVMFESCEIRLIGTVAAAVVL